MTIEELRELNPGHWTLPTDEEVANVVAEKEVREAAAAEEIAQVERRKQSIRDQIANLQSELNGLEGTTEVAQG